MTASGVMMQLAEAPTADRALSILRRWQAREVRDDGPLWHGIGKIRQALNADKESVRGVLIKLVARGDVELCEFANGQAWRAHYTPTPPSAEVADGHFILQREVIEGSRTFWFDAETFTNAARAKAALKWAEWEAQARAQEWGHTGRHRVQGIRLVSLVPAALAQTPPLPPIGENL